MTHSTSTSTPAFDSFDSATYSVYCGCGHIYITILSKEGTIIKVIAHRKSKFRCDITFFDALNRQTSFQTGRELEQVIDDLRGVSADFGKEAHFCQNYNITVKAKLKQGLLAGLSCADAVAKALEKEIERLTTLLASENTTGTL